MGFHVTNLPYMIWHKEIGKYIINIFHERYTLQVSLSRLPILCTWPQLGLLRRQLSVCFQLERHVDSSVSCEVHAEKCCCI
jgi:hypothetical protein